MTQRIPLLLVLAALLAPVSAHAQAEGFLSVCGNRAASVAEVARTCRLALETGALDPEQELAAAINLGGALLELDQPGLARDAYDRALALKPASALALAGRAEARAALGETGLAAVDWNRAVDLAPNDAALRAARGAFRLRAGNPGGALADFEAAQARNPDDMALTFNRALALAELGRDAEAEAGLSRVIAADPGDTGAWLNRARLRAARDPLAALADYDRAVALAGDWSQPLVERGALNDALGRKDAANADFRRAWELGHRSEALNARIMEMGR